MLKHFDLLIQRRWLIGLSLQMLKLKLIGWRLLMLKYFDLLIQMLKLNGLSLLMH